MFTSNNCNSFTFVTSLKRSGVAGVGGRKGERGGGGERNGERREGGVLLYNPGNL